MISKLLLLVSKHCVVEQTNYHTTQLRLHPRGGGASTTSSMHTLITDTLLPLLAPGSWLCCHYCDAIGARVPSRTTTKKIHTKIVPQYHTQNTSVAFFRLL